ncbi:MAG TPA: hypothetical protein VHE35_11800 [Kofleriaceae bacterium]|nr:hypothetical protein [Kofleriaceae bacterium]
MRISSSMFIISLALGCGHAAAPAPATPDVGAIAAEDQVDEADRNHDGVVDADEEAAADEADAQAMMTRLDRDGDHRLSAAEVAAATGDDATMLGDFASHDRDGDGFLTIDDVRALFASHVAATPETQQPQARHPGGRGHGRGRGGRGRGGGGPPAGDPSGGFGDPDPM